MTVVKQPSAADQAEAPQVTVVCITYKHEDYIRQALDSFLMQKTTFRFQVFVGEDCGPDGTADIIREYADRYPDIIVPFLRTTNLGAQRNLIDMCQRAGTRYIAFCEGDDYWTDEYKLQKQYDHLEAHPELSGCFHNTEIVSDGDWYLGSFYQPDRHGKRLIPFSIPRYDQSVRAMRMGYYLRFGPAHTSSFFFRWNYDLVIPDWYYQTVFGDHPLMALQIGNGLLGFLPDVMSAYRRHSGGIIMSSSERLHHLTTRRDWLVVLEGLEEHFRTHYGDFAASDIKARMITEMRNYLVHAARSGTEAEVAEVIAQHPRAFAFMMDDYASTSRLRYSLISRLYGGDVAGVRPSALSEAAAMLPRHALAKRRRQRQHRRALDYAAYADTAKAAGKWLFMCDDQVSYRDNVRSFYEYVVLHHPEIEPHWLTRSDWVMKLLQSEGLPVTKLKTSRSRELLATAEVLFCQSLRSDLFEMRGFNPGLKIVRLPNNPYADPDGIVAHGLQTYTESELASESHDSPRQWTHPNNLVVTDSGRYQQRLLAAAPERSATVVRVAAEPRLRTVLDPLLPPGDRHLLVMLDGLPTKQEESAAAWLAEHAEEVAGACREQGITLQLFGRWLGRLRPLIVERVQLLDGIRLLETNDLHASLPRFAGAIVGNSTIAYSLCRLGVPVIRYAPSGPAPTAAPAAPPPGPTVADLPTALRQAIATQAADPATKRAVDDYFELSEHWEDPLAEVFAAVQSWLGRELP